jgi:4-hydroxy-3-methylbut-2-en-1-yl diphosphate synthase IspG/GcpE
MMRDGTLTDERKTRMKAHVLRSGNVADWQTRARALVRAAYALSSSSWLMVIWIKEGSKREFVLSTTHRRNTCTVPRTWPYASSTSSLAYSGIFMSMLTSASMITVKRWRPYRPRLDEVSIALRTLGMAEAG